MAHDDTCVDSTASIHYPAHCESVRRLRPDLAPCSLDDWFRANFRGILPYLQSLFSEEQMAAEHRIWREFTTSLGL